MSVSPTSIITRAASLPFIRELVSSSILSDRRLVLSSGIVAGGILATKLLGYVRVSVVAGAFGTSAAYDAFRAANSFSDLLDSVIAGTTLASVFIPIFSSYLVRDRASRDEAWRFASATLNSMFIVITLLSGLAMIIAAPIVEHILAPGFPLDQRALTVQLLQLALISAIVFGISGTITGILHAHNFFILPALAGPVHNLSMIVSVILLAPRFGIFGLAYGVILGSIMTVVVQVPGLVRVGGRYFLTLGWRQASMFRLAALFGPRVLTTMVVQLSRVFMVNLASRLGEGSVGGLDYAYSLWQFPETLIGTAIALAVFPRLAARAAEGNLKELGATYKRSLISIVGLALPATLMLVLFARPIITLLLRRGAFGEASTDLVTSILQFYALAVFGESLLELTSRIFYAQQDARTPMFVAIVTMLVRIALMLALYQPLGAPGLALAYAMGVSLEAGALYMIARRRVAF
jgi:putative peptidoglycan lipid II flippase